MYSNPQRRSDRDTQELRREAGDYLRELREKRGLSQRDLASAVGTQYYTFISQLETGRGRLPPDRYLVWAKALGIDAKDFVKRLMRFYDPVTYGILFGVKPAAKPGKPSKAEKGVKTTKPGKVVKTKPAKKAPAAGAAKGKPAKPAAGKRRASA
jgi:transcriptional regulator with XRE-family HTH domain